MRMRSLAALSLAAALALTLAACAHVAPPEIAGAPTGGQPKRLAWAEGCWRSADAQMSFGLTPDRARAGVHSGVILEVIDGQERATSRLLLSTDGQMLSFDAPEDRADAFWRSPYDAPATPTTMRRVNLSGAEQAELVSKPHFAAFADAYGGRLLIVGDAASLGIFSVHPGGTLGDTYFSGVRTACRDGGPSSDQEI